jgi:cell wall-associated NlpC family hydrolase
MMMTKQPDWAQALYTQIEAFNKQPFAWGTHDCCSFAADCVLSMTGVDQRAGYRGGYSTALGAARKLAKAGGMEAAISAELGEPLAPQMAQRGDVVCFTSPLGDTCGICLGSTIAAAGLQGITHTPMLQAFKAWRV